MRFYLSLLLIFVHTNKNIIGCVFGLFGLGLYYSHIINDNWIFIVFGLYAIGYRIAPSPPQIISKYKGFLSAAELQQSLSSLVHKVEPRIPPEMFGIVIEIKKDLENAITYFDDEETNIHSKHIIQQTVVDYLPKILDTYIKIPSIYRKLYLNSGSQSATNIATNQLRFLQTQTQKTSLILLKKNINELKIHQRFLESKFSIP